MNLFSISQLAQFSGIKPHTIRMWEQRYNALQPNRSEGNTRYYDNTQLRRLLNIVSLREFDFKVAELCSMSDKKLFKLIEEFHLNSKDEMEEYFISQLLAAGMSYDEISFEKTFSHCLLRYGVKETYSKVIYPMLVRIGLMWASDSIPPAHEHFISNILRQKLLTAVDSLPPPKPNTDTWLLFLPENEFHEIGLLFAHYLIRFSGRKTIYMGANVPLKSLDIAVEDTNPDNLLLFLVRRDLPENIQDYLNSLSNNIGQNKIYAAGSPKLISSLKAPRNTAFLESANALEELLLNNTV